MSRIVDFDPSPVEPAHPMDIRTFENLVIIQRHLREQLQARIDQAFDRASRQVGFVVATTLPVTLEIGSEGTVQAVRMGGEHLEGTVFEREMTAALEGLVDSTIAGAAAGTYDVSLPWFEALRLRLHTEWMEPAHVARRVPSPSTPPPPAGVREPAHWFDPGYALASHERMAIAVLDEVYPELRIADRIAAAREFVRRTVPPEPAHYRDIGPGTIR